MNRLIITLIAAMAAISSYADNWCETLIKQLNATSGIDKTIRTNRDQQSRKIVTAVYDYKFSSDNIFRKIRDDMRSHIDEADFFSETGEQIALMRFTIDGLQWDCKLQHTRQGNIFLVNVSQAGHSPQQPPATKQSKGAVGKKTQQKHTQTKADKTDIEQNNLELEKAERARREKLGR